MSVLSVRQKQKAPRRGREGVLLTDELVLASLTCTDVRLDVRVDQRLELLPFALPVHAFIFEFYVSDRLALVLALSRRRSSRISRRGRRFWGSRIRHLHIALLVRDRLRSLGALADLAALRTLLLKLFELPADR